MKNSFFYLVVGFLLIGLPAVAQDKSAKVYIAKVSKGGALTPQQMKRRNDEIKFQATNRINKNLVDLLNTLTFDGLGDAERIALMQNSFLPSPNQIFSGDDVVIEDDIDPTHTSAEGAVDVDVEKYLRNMDLFYVKSDTLTIAFSQLIVSDVQEGKDYPYVKVFFTQTFRSKNKQVDRAYQPVRRVAELKAEIVDGKWRTFITRLAFLRPGEALTQLTNPTILQADGPKKPLDSKEVSFRKADNPIDSLTVKWDTQWLSVVRSTIDMIPTGYYRRGITTSKSQDNISITLSREDQQLTFRRIDGSTVGFTQARSIVGNEKLRQRSRRRLSGWLQVATGVVSLGASYAGYAYLQKQYDGYSHQVSALNTDYAIWQTLAQRPDTSPLVTMPFTSYAQPGIYAVYGGGVAGGGLLINGIRLLLKAGK